MGHNLHISYDLIAPGQNYEAVIAKIQTLGEWAKIHKSYWYVNSPLTAAEAATAVWSVMDSSDTVYVVDASTNEAAYFNLLEGVPEYIKGQWNQ
jgi:hypothetical protein